MINLREINNPSTEDKQQYETYIRTLFLYRYLNRMILALNNSNTLTGTSTSELNDDSVRDKEKLLRLVDSMLRGSSSERVAGVCKVYITVVIYICVVVIIYLIFNSLHYICIFIEHMRIYGGASVMHWQLQNCFYLLFESEIETITSVWLRESARHRNIPLYDELIASDVTKYIDIMPPQMQVKGIGGRIRKIFKKNPKWVAKTQDEKLFAANVIKLKNFHKEYLLDKLELNVKSRCVFAWTGMIYRLYRLYTR